MLHHHISVASCVHRTLAALARCVCGLSGILYFLVEALQPVIIILLIWLTTFLKVVNYQLNALDEYSFVKYSSLRKETRKKIPAPHAALKAEVLVLGVSLWLLHEGCWERALDQFWNEAGGEQNLTAAGLVEDHCLQVNGIKVPLSFQDYVKWDVLNEIRLRYVQNLLTA